MAENTQNKDESKPTFSLFLEKETVPYRCPVCDGTGSVPDGFYLQLNGCWSGTNTISETCRSCYGTGIVWR